MRNMEHKCSRKDRSVGGNAVLLWLLVCFYAMTCVIGSIACYSVYHQKRTEILSKYDYRLLQMTEKYKDITGEFWTVYLPIYDQGNSAIQDYFSSKNEVNSQISLRYELECMAATNERIQWIILFSPYRDHNIVYTVYNRTIQRLSNDLCEMMEFGSQTHQMNILPEKNLTIHGRDYCSLIITGGSPNQVGGRIAVGFDVSELNDIGKLDSEIHSLEYHIVLDDTVIFSTADSKPDNALSKLRYGQDECFVDGEKLYVSFSIERLRGESVFYTIQWKELTLYAIRNTYYIVILIIVITMMATVVYFIMLKSISTEVNLIRDGLAIMGDNHLDYRIPESLKYPELKPVAESINRMASSLQDNIAHTKEIEKQQRNAELQELQSKYNPHFLYNTLEFFRMRCYQNGDDETAELIRQAASFFRGYIDSKTFVPIYEELAFSKRYLGLFRGRFGDSVQVMYDIDTDVLKYEIIRNVFQPLIENYFEHGFNPDSTENYLLFRGYLCKDDAIVFEIEDNGRGMDEDAIESLNHKLRQPLSSVEESYGLRNLHQRIQLVYGDGFGITVKRKGNGLCIFLKIRRQTQQEIAEN